jgi:hypothetical protein
MRFVFSAAAAAAVIALVACSSDGSSSGGSGGSLDCGWLASDNCWKTTAAVGCFDMKGDAPGTLSADNKTCTYANGKVVTFEQPLVLPIPTGATWSFTVTANGQQCLTFKKPNNDTMELTTSAGTVNETNSSVGLTVTCPNGTSYNAPPATELSLFKCDGGLLSFPGSEWSSSSAGTSTTVDFSLVGTRGDTSLVFTCQR